MEEPTGLLAVMAALRQGKSISLPDALDYEWAAVQATVRELRNRKDERGEDIDRLYHDATVGWIE